MSDFTLQNYTPGARYLTSSWENHPQLKIPFRLCRDSEENGALMALELIDEIQDHNRNNEPTRAIIPCGPACWYRPFSDLVNRKR